MENEIFLGKNIVIFRIDTNRLLVQNFRWPLCIFIVLNPYSQPCIIIPETSHSERILDAMSVCLQEVAG